MKLSQRAKNVKESSTLFIAAKAKAMKESGVDVISFSAGEPDFNTPDHICEAATKAMQDGFTKYTPSTGILDLRKAICKKLKEENSLEYEPSQIVVSNGAKHSLFNTFSAILEENDEVMICAPYWISYTEVIKFCGGVAKIVFPKKENGYKVTVKELNENLTVKTKAIVINSPSNPSGIVYNKEELEKIADFAVRNDLIVISDEIYEKLIFTDGLTHTSIASLNNEIYKRTIVINGFSKSYSMTGWRIGYTASPKECAEIMGNLQSHATSNPNSIAQKAALAALTSSQQSVDDMWKEFKKRQKYMYERLDKMGCFELIKPDGAFYIFASVEKLIGKNFDGFEIKDGSSFAEIVLKECQVAIVPGEDFGYKNSVRFSYSTSIENIEKGMDRIEKFINQL